MKIYASQAIIAAVLLQFTQVNAAGSCMVDGEVFKYCSNDLDGAWSFENGGVCITEAECNKFSPPNGPIVPATTTPPPTTTTKPPTTTPTPSGPTQCEFDGEVFPVCKDSTIWSFENGGVCIGASNCPSTPPTTTTKAPTTTPPPTTTTKPPTTTPAPTVPTQCDFNGEVFPVCKDSTIWSFENGGVCIGASNCPSTPPPTTTTKAPTTTPPPTTTTKAPTTTPPPTTTTKPPTTTPPSSGSAALYAQCGGIGYSGPTTCVAGAICSKQNDYYSQCISDGSNPANSGMAALWAQCGGIGYTGFTTCVSGARCNKQSDYYSQCVPL